MIKIFFFFCNALIGCGLIVADELPMMEEGDWIGYYVGIEDRSFHFALKDKGHAIVFLKEGRKQISEKESFEMNFILIEKLSSGELKYHRDFQRDGFNTEQTEATTEVEQVEFEGIYKKSGYRVRVTNAVQRGEILTHIEVVEPLRQKNLQPAIEVKFQKLAWVSKGENPKPDELDQKLKGASLKMVLLNGRKHDLTWEEQPYPNLETDLKFKKGILEFEYVSKTLAKRKVSIAGLKKNEGIFRFLQPANFWEEVSVLCLPLTESLVADIQGKQAEGERVKLNFSKIDRKREGFGSFVIEVD